MRVGHEHPMHSLCSGDATILALLVQMVVTYPLLVRSSAQDSMYVELPLPSRKVLAELFGNGKPDVYVVVG